MRTTFEPVRTTFEPVRTTFKPVRTTFEPERTSSELVRRVPRVAELRDPRGFGSRNAQACDYADMWHPTQATRPIYDQVCG